MIGNYKETNTRKGAFRETIDQGLSLLFPRKCPVCEKIVDPQNGMVEQVRSMPVILKKWICPGCYQRLPRLSGALCTVCGKPVEEETELCAACKEKHPGYERCVGLWDYADPLTARILTLVKYKNRRDIAEFIGTEMWRRFSRTLLSWEADCIIPVPLHKKKERKRGYNQAQVMALTIGSWGDLPVLSDVLVRVKETKALKEYDAGKRRSLLKDAFSCEGLPDYGKTVVLVDDIVTTGATIEACTRCLKEAGAERVYVLSAAIEHE